MSDARPVSPAMARSLALALQPLAELRAWDRVASLAERVAAALAGVEGLDPRDASDLASLSAAWVALPSDLREFLVAMLATRGAEAVAARVALGNLLEGRPARVEPWARGALRRAWLDRYGVDPDPALPPWR